MRVEVRATEQLTLRAAVLDGVPNDPTVAGGTRVRWSSDEGILLVAEADLGMGNGDDGRWARAAIGAWLLGEGTLFRERDDPAQGLAAFARCGLADDRVHVFGWYAGGGLVYTGLIPGRDDDQFGLGVAAAIAVPHRKRLCNSETHLAKPTCVTIDAMPREVCKSTVRPGVANSQGHAVCTLHALG